MRTMKAAPLVLLGLTACGGTEPAALATCPTTDGGTIQNPDGTTPALVVTIDRTRARVANHLGTTVPVAVERLGGLQGAVTVSLEGVHAWGIEADPLVIPAGSDVGLLEIHAFAADTAIAIAPGTVVARTGDVQASVGLELDVSDRNGMPDGDFAVGGLLTTHTVASDVGSRIATMADGRFVTAGSRSNNALVLRRHLADGQPDVGFFGSGELVQTIGAGTHQVNTLSVDSDGRVLVGGFVGASGFLARYQANGQPDDGFGSSGVVFIADGDVQHARVRADGRMVVLDSDGLQCHLRGLDANGQPDASFAGGDAVVIDRGAEDYCSTFAMRADESVVVFGSNGTNGAYAVAYDAAGQADTDYGSGGVCIPDPNGNDFVPERSLALTDGRILVASSNAMMALTSDCHGASPFGTDGYLPTATVISAITTDGRRIYRTSTATNQLFVCATFMDGVPDLSFGPNGCGLPSTLPGTAYANDLALTSDGSLLTVGTMNLGAGDFDSFLFRNVALVR